MTCNDKDPAQVSKRNTPGARILTADVQSEVDARTRRRQAETHDDEDGRVRRNAHQDAEDHGQGQRGQEGLRAAQSANTNTPLWCSWVHLTRCVFNYTK